MKQVTVTRSGQITNQASFPTMEEAQAWLAHHEGMKSFGQPKQIVQQQIELSPAVLEKQMVLIKEAELDEEGNELSPAEFEEQEVVIQEAVSEMQEVELAGEYEVEIEDKSAQLAQDAANAEALKYLAETDWYVSRMSETGVAIPQEITAARAAARAAIIR
jgi:hypothetical protein